VLRFNQKNGNESHKAAIVPIRNQQIASRVELQDE